MRELDIEAPGALERYLIEHGRVPAGDAGRLSISVLRGGVSNRTVRVRLPGGEEWVVKQALAKLRVSVDWYADPARIHREALGMEALRALAPPGAVVRLLFEDEESHLLAMEAVREPFENWKEALLAGRIADEAIDQFARLLAAIHAGGARSRLLLSRDFADKSLFAALRVEPYYIYTAGRLPEAADFLRALAAEVMEASQTLVHGDYSPKNILIHDGRLVLLDHEVIHLGDPAFDLGFSLTHFLSKAHHLRYRRSAFARGARRYWAEYARAVAAEPFAGEELERRAVRHTLGCLLARAAGRSRLEYLSEGERSRQAKAAIRLVAQPPARVDELVGRFVESIGEGDGSD